MTPIPDPAALSVTEIIAAFEAGALLPSALVEATIARIETLDPVVHAYLRHDFAAARAQAAAADARLAAGRRLGPLDGIPYAVKDNFYTADFATTAGSAVPQRHDPALDSAMVERLRAQGAILMGKLNTWEYGTGNGKASFDLPAPPARNPWNPGHFTGGSSSGSGVAVAAGMAAFALGTDTGGSVRLPAAGCGVVGLKPTFGRLSRHGMMPNCWSFDTVGPLTASVADAALIYDLLAGRDPRDHTTLRSEVLSVRAGLGAGVEGLRVGHVRNLALGDLVPQPAILAALEKAAAALADLGAEIRDIAMPVAPADYRRVAAPINRSESFAIHERDFLEHRDLMGEALRTKMEAGMYMRAADYIAALRERGELTRRTDAIFDEVDILLLPMTYVTAPRFEEEEEVVAFTATSAGSPFSLTGHPALSLPAGRDARGMPVAVQLAAGFRDEARLLRAAAALEPRLRGDAPARVDPALTLSLATQEA
ncbi:amidase [Mangrovicoccus algicola]|uniref:Amidase n=1 Tax=Mangrovicoccus algicola TaxID=2771008 RepID=A0A8J7CHW1_9RHOB|nr:amidase [Mangrovicoccus algicola]MBE3638775.1 amidase [Mangrovicoccus algicola]